QPGARRLQAPQLHLRGPQFPYNRAQPGRARAAVRVIGGNRQIRALYLLTGDPLPARIGPHIAPFAPAYRVFLLGMHLMPVESCITVYTRPVNYLAACSPGACYNRFGESLQGANPALPVW